MYHSILQVQNRLMLVAAAMSLLSVAQAGSPHGAGTEFEAALRALDSESEEVRVGALKLLKVPLVGPESGVAWEVFRKIRLHHGLVLLTVEWAAPREALLLLYNESGKLISTVKSLSIEAFTTQDITGDANPEIIVVSLDGRGTGFVLERYHIYRIGSSIGLQEVWSGDRRRSESEPIYPVSQAKVEGSLLVGPVTQQQPAELRYSYRSVHETFFPACTVVTRVEGHESYVLTDRLGGVYQLAALKRCRTVCTVPDDVTRLEESARQNTASYESSPTKP